MNLPTIVVNKKTGLRIVKVGKKRISIDPKISERELLKWILKTFVKRKKKKPITRKMKEKEGEVKIAVSHVQNNDREVRDAKEKLAEKQKELDLLKLSAAVVSGIQQSSGIQQPALMPANRPALMSQSSASSSASSAAGPRTPQRAARTTQPASASAQKVPSPATVNVPVDRLKKAQASQTRINTLNKQLSTENLALTRELTAAYTKQLTNMTVPYMKGLAGMSDALYKSEGHSRQTLQDQLIADKAIDEDKIKTEIGDRDYSFRKDAIKHLVADIKAEQANYDALTAVQGGNGKTEDIGLSENQINGMMEPYKPFSVLGNSNPKGDYLGCIAADEIPLLKPGAQKRICWIMNTDRRSLPGSHWVCFLIDVRPKHKHVVEYYDPLADPISSLGPQVMVDLKQLIKRVFPKDQYLKFKVNTITDQNNISSNCGPFCVRFLQARLTGETFGKATGLDALGERDIEQWKLVGPQKTWISGEVKEPLRDITVAPKRIKQNYSAHDKRHSF